MLRSIFLILLVTINSCAQDVMVRRSVRSNVFVVPTLTATGDQNKVTFSWTDVSSTSYDSVHVFKGSSASTLYWAASVPRGVGYYVDSNYNYGTMRYAKIRVKSNSGKLSDFGAVVSDTVNMWFGSELVTNGTFSVDANWTKSGEATISGGTGNVISTAGAYAVIYQTVNLTSGYLYYLTFSATRTSGSVIVYYNTEGNTTFATISSSGNYNYTFTAPATNQVLAFKRSWICNIAFDNVSIKRILNVNLLPGMPGSFAVTDSVEGVDLSWTASSPAATKYVILKNGAYYDTTSSTSWTDTDTTTGLYNTYRVYAYNSVGNSDTATSKTAQRISSNTYYFSDSGNDANNGTNPNTPKKTIAAANALSLSGKIVKFKGSFTDATLICQTGATYSSYGGSGATISYTSRSVSIRNRTNVTVRDLTLYNQVYIRDAGDVTVRNLTVLNPGTRADIGGIQVQDWMSGIIRIASCTVKNFGEGIRVYAMDQSDLDDLDSLVIESCTVDSCYMDVKNKDAIRVIGNEYVESIDWNYRAVIRNNEVTNWSEDAIDVAFSSNLIVERNLLHDNKTPNIYDTETSGIKLGEQNADTTLKGSTGNIIRYNKIYNINRPTQASTNIARGLNASRTNDALIHHNVIYNVKGMGFYQNGLNTIDLDSDYHIKFYNNTVSSDSSCFLTASGGSNVRSYVKNNIFITKGNQNTIYALEDTRIGKNVFVNRGGVYEGTTTRRFVAVWQKYGDVDSSSTSYYGVDSTTLFQGAGDYKIRTTSYTGEDLDLLYDIEGNAVDTTNPDCGAYEYDGSYLWLILGLRRRRKNAL